MQVVGEEQVAAAGPAAVALIDYNSSAATAVSFQGVALGGVHAAAVCLSVVAAGPAVVVVAGNRSAVAAAALVSALPWLSPPCRLAHSCYSPALRPTP